VKKFLAELEVSPLFTAMRDLSGLSGTLSAFDDYSTDFFIKLGLSPLFTAMRDLSGLSVHSALDDYSTDFYSVRVISPLYSHERFIRIICTQCFR
jgi:hypothetical protein